MDNPIDNTAVPAPATASKAPKLRTFADFLESCGPDSAHDVAGLVRAVGGTGSSLRLQTPEIELHCDNEICDGVRRFQCEEDHTIYGSVDLKFVTYVCKNCGQREKTFALAVEPHENRISGQVYKLGELPPFGPPTPPRVMKLVGEDRELFLKGRRAELRGLGIGAFAYYRRVVEEQKGRIIEEVGKVAAKIRPSKETVELFAKAKTETQFSTGGWPRLNSENDVGCRIPVVFRVRVFPGFHHLHRNSFGLGTFSSVLALSGLQELVEAEEFAAEGAAARPPTSWPAFCAFWRNREDKDRSTSGKEVPSDPLIP